MDPILNRSNRYIPVAAPSIGPREVAAVSETVSSGWISQGPNVRAFEQTFAESHERRFGVACNSGTTALRLSLTAMDVGAGDFVLCPTMTMVAVPNAIVESGATPVFVDSESATGNMDPSLLAEAIADYRPKAVIFAHLYGVPGDLSPVPNDILIEDCAEIHYGRYGNRSIGTNGKMATFSFYANKIITTGEGGMVLCDDAVLAQRLNSLRSHAFTEGEHFCHQELAFGFRMTDVCASIGIAQHAQRREFLARRSEIAELYLSLLEDVPYVRCQERPAGSVWWVFPLQILESRVTRDALRACLADEGIETRTWFKPMHEQKHLLQFADQEYPVADALYRNGLYLPLYPGLTDGQVELICDVITKACAAPVC